MKKIGFPHNMDHRVTSFQDGVKLNMNLSKLLILGSPTTPGVITYLDLHISLCKYFLYPFSILVLLLRNNPFLQSDLGKQTITTYRPTDQIYGKEIITKNLHVQIYIYVGGADDIAG